MKMGRNKIHGVSGTLLARQPNEPSEAAAPDSNLQGYGDVYTVRDLRKRSKKEPADVKSLSTQNLDITLSEKAPRNYNPDITIDTPGYRSLYFRYKDDDSPIRVELDYKIAKTGRYGSYFADLNVDFDKIYNWEQKNYSNVNTYGIIETAYYNKLIDGWLPEYFDGIVNAKTSSGALVDFDRRKELAKSFVDSILPLGSQEVQNKVLEKYKKTFYKRYQEKAAAGLGKPTIKLEFENNDDLQKFFKDHEENLIDSYVEDATIVDDEPDTSRRRLNGLAGQNPDKYNYKISDLKCEGMQPTYKKLKDYGHLIGKASGKKNFCGFGFDNTEKLLISKVVDNYKSVAPLAAHLKGDSERQSAFNVWYWLHENIRYNYDAPGAEEIRSPARAWADRKSGVDCDCLAVFTYCLLLAMGYKPQFEIVAFKDTWAHIYVNLNGLAVDRVLNKFGARPPLIQKKKMLEVPVYSLEGMPDINAALSGLEATVLKKMQNGTATQKDCCDYRKSKCLRRFAGDPVEQKVMAMFMPYVYDVDPTDGAIYFYGQPIATAARQIDRMLQDVAMRHKGSLSGCSEAELNGIFKKIGTALKKAATATAKAVAAPVKAAVKVTTSATKAAVNATKATVNVVKAGVQAATGNKEGAKETIQKAGEQAKAAVVNPTKDAVNITKETVKETVVDPTVTAVRATVEIVKVILVKINPVTVLMRNALRALIAINFLGIATRLNIGYRYYELSQGATLMKEGYTQEELNAGETAIRRVMKFYTKMGGDQSKIIAAVVNGAKRKALFKGDYKKEQVINDDDTLSGLGEPLTIGACLAAVGGFFASIWKWVKNIGKWVVNNRETITETAQTVSTVVKTVKDVKNGGTATETTPATAEVEVNNTEVSEGGNSGKIWLLVASAAAFVAFAASGKKKKKK